MPDFNPQLIRKEEDRLTVLSDTGTFWLLILIVLALLALAVHILGGSPSDGSLPGASLSVSPTATPVPRLYTVSYKSGVFSPTNLRIHAGDTVRFRNDGVFPIHVITDPHPAHDGLPGFDSVGDIPAGSFFAFTFAAKGTFGYHNERNVNETGTIIVR